MIGRKKWRNRILVEGVKEAQVIALMEGFPDPNPDFTRYPLDVTLPEKLTFWKAIKKAVWLSERCIYNILVKDKNIEV